MKKHLLFTLFLALGFSISITAQEGNLLQDYQMDDGSIWVQGNYGGTGAAVFTLDNTGLLSGDNSMLIEVTGEGNTWDVQFIHPVVPVEEGVTYYLSFMALVEEDFPCDIVWELEGDPYTKYYQENWTFTPDTIHYFREIVAAGTDPIANIKFLLSGTGTAGKTVALDSIVLSEERWEYGEPVSIQGKMIESMDFNVFPNPAANYFEISGNLADEQNVSISVYNIVGQKQLSLMNEKLTSGEFRKQFNTNELESGIYNVRISTERQEINKLLVIK